MITIDIEIKDRNRLKEFFQNFHSKAEDIAYSIIQRIPEKLLPHWLMDWLEEYLDKRIGKLKQQSIQMTWQNMYLQNSLAEIHNNRQQDTKEASPDD